MTSSRARQPSEAGSVQLHPVSVGSNRAMFYRLKINEALVFIHTLESTQVPVPLGQLSHQFAAGVVQIKMLIARALALPDEGSIFQPMWIVQDLYPGLRRFAKGSSGFPILRIRKVQIQIGLFAVLGLVDNLLAVWSP